MHLPSRPLALELLEDRTVPATFGNAWIDLAHLTVSFAPDGTAVGSQRSELATLLGQGYSATAWKAELLRAVQAWAAAANINVGLVADYGAAFGSSAASQGDLFQGDLRFGAVDLSDTQLAQSHPFQPLFGSWSGDILLNSDKVFGPGGYDLFTVALQEVGHALGLGNSADPTSAMYDAYLGPRSGLSSGDVAAIQALYGARRHDAYDAARSNDALSSATVLNLGSLLLPKAVRVTGDVTTAGDVDHYRITGPLTGLTTISLKTAGVSLLAGKLTVLDAQGKVVGSGSSDTPLTLALRPGQAYTIRVESAGGTFAVGAYELEVTPLGTIQLPDASAGQTERLLNDSFATATPLTSANGMGYSAVGTLVLGDVDMYKLTVSQAASQARVLSVGVTPLLGLGPILGIGATPRVAVYDAAGNLLASQVIANQDGTYAIEVAGIWQAGQTLYVKVFGAGFVNLGGYGLSVGFQATPTALETMADLELTGSAAQAAQTLTVSQAELYHFVLSADGPQAAANVRLTIRDAMGRVVATLGARAGETNSLNVWLAPGEYTFEYSAGTSDRSALRSLNVRLQVVDLSDSIDPYTADPYASPRPQPAPQPQPTSQPAPQPQPGPTSSTTTASQPTTTSSTSSGSSYTYTTASSKPTRDPYSDPYSDPFWY